MTVREALHRANKAIDKRFEDRPLTNARIRDVVGETLRHMSDYDEATVQLKKACELFEKELGPKHAETLEARHRLAMTLGDAGKLSECAEVFEDLVKTQRRSTREPREIDVAQQPRDSLPHAR